MQTSQESQSSNGVYRLYKQPVPEVLPYWSSVKVPGNVKPPDNGHVVDMTIQPYNDSFFTLESYSACTGSVICDSPSAISSSSSRSNFSSQGSHSCVSDPRLCSENMCGSPVSGSSGVVDDEYELRNKLRELEVSLLGPDVTVMDRNCCPFDGGMLDEVGVGVSGNRMMGLISRMDVKQVLILCAQTADTEDILYTANLMDVLGQKVSIAGTPIERLAAYMLEGLRARLEYSGYTIYRKLTCDQPTGKELLTYMHILNAVCPFYDFGYVSSNVAIQEAMENEGRIHIIDFHISLGSQWISLIESLARRPGGPPFVRITGVDDEGLAFVRGGGLELVGQSLAKVAESCGVPFEFHASAAMSGCEVNRENLRVWPDEALAVNFPYILHHMPDESVNTINHRDRLLRLVKSLGPKVVTLMEQEINTNTAHFMNRFLETLDYYTAIFESIDVAIPRDDKKRISAEQNCVARDVVNLIACEGAERVERHELLGKWKARFTMAGFKHWPLSPRAKDAVKNMMRKYHSNYRINEHDGTLYMGWRQRDLATSSAWR